MRKTEIIAEFHVPAHKLQKNALLEFLKALCVRYMTDTPEEMLSFYCNKTPGKPARLDWADVQAGWNLERRRIGFYAGNWDCRAIAEQELDAQTAQWIRQQHEKNRQSSS